MPILFLICMMQIDLFMRRVQRLSTLLQQIDVEVFTSCDIITTLYYILSKKGKIEALDSILDVNEMCSVIEFGNKEML